jgi:hypothetical protein
VIAFDLSAGNSAISGFASPYAAVTVNRTDNTHATITFTSLTANENIYLMGDGGTVGVNVHASSWTLGSVSGSNGGTGFSPGPYSSGGAGNEDGFGSFNQTINSHDGFTSSADDVSFVLTDTGGTWASASDVLVNNGNGYLAAAHIFVTSSPAAQGNGAITTGYAAGTVGTVPEPATWAMVLIGFAGLGYAAGRRRKESVSALA